jgi:hypothetical protein
MNSSQRKEMYDRIVGHGLSLLVLFPDATEQDPIRLCKKLRRIETKLDFSRVLYCNGQVSEDSYDKDCNEARLRVEKLLNSDRVWINNDPRGYGLKKTYKY